MALVECRECNREVSTEAPTCPQCGVPDPGMDPETAKPCVQCDRRINVPYEGTCPYCGEEYPYLESKTPSNYVVLNEGSEQLGNQSKKRSGPDKSDGTAGCLGLFLGPVGLWYKGQWAAGFAWLVMAIIGSIASGGILAPLFWIGMAVHAYQADVA